MTDMLPAYLVNGPLARRIAVTLLALLVYRLGCWIPLPGIDVGTLLRGGEAGRLGLGFERVSLMALGFLPMLSALMFLETAMIVCPRFRRWAAEPVNHGRLTGWTNTAALGFAAVQASGLAGAFEDIKTLVPEPGPLFRVGIVVTVVSVTATLIWLASLITRYGIGHGVWILIALPYAIFFCDTLFIQASFWGPLSAVTIGMTVAFLALAAAAMATVLKARPSLADAGDLVWVPVLGFALAHWLLLLVWLVAWLTMPSGQAPEFDHVAGAAGAQLLPPVGLVIVAILRRRSLAIAQGDPISLASAVPLAAVMAALGAVGSFLESLPAQPLFPSAVSVMLLSGVGLLVVTRLRAQEA